jgi:probable HAF family extracellular repeat protein
MYQQSAVIRSSFGVIRRITLAACSLVGVFLATGHAAAQPVIVNLGIISGGDSALPTGISDNGSVVCGAVIFDIADTRAFRWTSGTGMVNLGFLSGGDSAIASDMSADGSVIVGASNSSTGNFAFRWTSGSGMVSLGVLSGNDSSYAEAVSSDGLIVVGTSSDQSDAFPVKWSSAGGMQDLGVLANINSASAMAANWNGSFIVGFSEGSSNDPPVYWTTAIGPVSLGLFPGVGATGGVAYDVSRYTDVVVGGILAEPPSGFRTYAFRWTSSGGLEDLGNLAGGTNATAFAISGNGGGIIGTADSSNTNERGFVYTPTLGMVGLLDYLDDAGVDLTGWSELVATDISYDGTSMTGTGIISGNARAWVIQGLPLVCCPADYNCDGFPDIFDYNEFDADYENGSFRADVNNDGFVDFFDFDTFVGWYEAGC